MSERERRCGVEGYMRRMRLYVGVRRGAEYDSREGREGERERERE